MLTTIKHAPGDTHKEVQDKVLGLIGNLKDPDPSVSLCAAVALGEMGDVRAVGPLSEALLKDEDGVLRMAAAKALGTICSTEDVEPAVREQAVVALTKAKKDLCSNVRENVDDALVNIRRAIARSVTHRRNAFFFPRSH